MYYTLLYVAHIKEINLDLPGLAPPGRISWRARWQRLGTRRRQAPVGASQPAVAPGTETETGPAHSLPAAGCRGAAAGSAVARTPGRIDTIATVRLLSCAIVHSRFKLTNQMTLLMRYSQET